MSKQSTILAALAMAVLQLLGGCTDDAPMAPPEPGAILLTVTTAGTMLDADGYELYVDDRKLRDVDVNETLTISGIANGSRKIELRDIQTNCGGSSTRTVRRTIEAGRTEGVRFDLTCRLAHLDRIVFTSNRAGGQDLFSAQVDGTDVRQHTFGAGFDIGGKYSPDGSRIAFHRDNDDVYVMNVDGSDLINLSNDPATDTFPSWSPDGTQIAFTSNRDGQRGIYVVDADGTGTPQRVTSGETGGTGADWSPVGNRFAYAVFTSNPSEEIFTFDRTTDAYTPLTNTVLGRHELPQWSPDGTRIAYYFWNLGNEGLYTMNADGTAAARVPGTTIDDEHPRWSPDGGRLAFTKTGATRSIWVIDLDGSNSTPVTDDGGDDFLPAWSPPAEL